MNCTNPNCECKPGSYANTHPPTVWTPRRTAVGITRIRNSNPYRLISRAEGGRSDSAEVRAKKGPTYMARAIRHLDPFQKHRQGHWVTLVLLDAGVDT